MSKNELMLTYEGQDASESAEHIYYPLYLNCYEEAIQKICMLMVRDDERTNFDEKFKYVCKDNISRIISFLGVRGSGKSTAMIEFCNTLQQMNHTGNRRWWLERSIENQEMLMNMQNRNIFFKVVSVIEASNLEDKEDLFELVMAAIFKEYQEEMKNSRGKAGYSYEHDRTEMLELFGKIMEGYYALKTVKNEEFGDSYISRLKYMSSSMDLRKMVQKLVEKFFDKCYDRKDNYFLVIAIDDLDLNIAHGYEMLEQLHKYFFIPHILILLSGDYNQVEYICKYHYVRSFSQGESHVIEEAVKNQCGKLAKDYIMKIMPIDFRVYMPDFQKASRRIIVNTRNNQKYDLKQYILKKVAETMHIFYDIDGVKRHFAESRTVRELISYTQFLESFDEIDFSAWREEEDPVQLKQYMQKYDKNHEQFNVDIQYRLMSEYLNDDQKELFMQILNNSLEKRPRVVCEKFFDYSTHDFFGVGQSWAFDDSTLGYKYGDLVQTVYEYGRSDEKNKAMVKCILASFTSEFVREKLSYQKNSMAASKTRSHKRLMSLLGGCVGNEWLGEMVPPIDASDVISRSDANCSGFIENVEFGLFFWKFEMENNLQETFGKVKDADFVSRSAVKKLLNPVLKNWNGLHLIPILECLNHFFKPLEGEFLQYKIEIMQDKEHDNKETINISVRDEKGTFDILNFIQKSIDISQENEKFYENLALELTRAVVSYIDERKLLKLNTLGHVQDTFHKIFYEYVRTESLFRRKYAMIDIAFPFYDFDLAYNVLKRTRRELKEDNPETIDWSMGLKYIRNAYMKMYDVLMREDAKYGEIGVNVNYAEKLISYPFIEAILNSVKKLGDDFEKQLCKNLKDICYISTIFTDDTPEGAE